MNSHYVENPFYFVQCEEMTGNVEVHSPISETGSIVYRGTRSDSDTAAFTDSNTGAGTNRNASANRNTGTG